MPNFKLVGFEKETDDLLSTTIFLKMNSLGFMCEDITITHMQRDHGEITKETICIYGYGSEDKEEICEIREKIPAGIDVIPIDSFVENLDQDNTPYIAVYVRTPEREHEIISALKKNRLYMDIAVRRILGEIVGEGCMHPYIKVITDDVRDLSVLNTATDELRTLGAERIFFKVISRIISAREMFI